MNKKEAPKKKRLNLTLCFLCEADHPKAQFYINENQKLGFKVYLYSDEYYLKPHYVVIIPHETFWKSETVLFQKTANGLYVFDSQGKPKKVS